MLRMSHQQCTLVCLECTSKSWLVLHSDCAGWGKWSVLATHRCSEKTNVGCVLATASRVAYGLTPYDYHLVCKSLIKPAQLLYNAGEPPYRLYCHYSVLADSHMYHIYCTGQGLSLHTGCHVYKQC